MPLVLCSPYHYIPVAATGTSSYYDRVIASNPVAYYRLGETYGNRAYDEMSRTYQGVYGNSPTLSATGLLTYDNNLAVTFNGSTQYVDLGSPIPLTNEVTAEAIISTTNTASTQIFVENYEQGGDAGFQLVTLVTSGHARISVRNGNATSYTVEGTTNVADGNPHHIVGKVTGGTNVELWVDGFMENSLTIPSGSLTVVSTNGQIARNSGGLSYFNGTIDEVAIYNTPLTSMEIQEHYWASIGLDNYFISVMGDSPVSYYRLNSYTIPTDYSTTVINDNPSAYWRMDGSGSPVPATIGGLNGTISGTNIYRVTSLLQGEPSDLAIYNDGLTYPANTITIPDGTANQNIFDGGGTAEAWIKPNSDGASTYGRFVAKGAYNTNGWDIMTNGNTILMYYYYSGTSWAWSSGGGIPTYGQTYHVVVNFNADTPTTPPEFYINGKYYPASVVLTGSGTRQTDVGYSMYISNFNLLNRAFDGTIDEVALYKTPLTPGQIADHYAKGTATSILNDETEGSYIAPSNLGSAVTSILHESNNDKSRDFNGSTNYLTVYDNPNIENIFDGGGTIEVVFEAQTAGQVAGRILSKQLDAGSGGWELYIDPTGGDTHDTHITFVQRFNAGASSGVWITGYDSLLYGNIYHVAITYDSSSTANNPTVYINGIIQATTEANTPGGIRDSDIGNNLLIGDRVLLDRKFDGLIDEIALYNTTLTSTQIKEHAAIARLNDYNELVLNTTGLRSYHPLDNISSSSRLEDLHANTNIPGTEDHSITPGTGATLVSSIVPTAPGGAIATSGAGTAVGNCPTFITATNNIALEVWFNWNGTSPAGGDYIVYNGNAASTGYGIFLRNVDGNWLEVICGGVGYAKTSWVPSIGELHHVVAQRNAGTWEIYTDRIKQTVTGNPAPNAPTFGSDNYIIGNSHDGTIDEVASYTSPLSYVDITKHFNKGVGYEYTYKLQELGAVRLWALTENSGTSAYEYMANNTGTYVNSPTYATSLIGELGGNTFDGITQRVTTSYNPPTGASPRTICLWMKTTSTGYEAMAGYGTNTGTGSLFNTALSSTGTLQVAVSGNRIGRSILNDGRTHFVAVTFNGSLIGDLQLYVDGKLEEITSEVNPGSALNTSAGVLYIGANESGGSYFNGILEGVAIYDKALTGGEIKQLYDTGIASATANSITISKSYSNLVYDYNPHHFWRLAEPSGTTAYDFDISNTKNGTYAGSPGAVPSLIGEAGAHQFYGTGQYVSTTLYGGSVAGSANRTICAWINTSFNTAGYYQYIVSYGDQTAGTGRSFNLIVHENGTFYVGLNASSAVSSTVVNDGNTHFVCAVLNGTTINDISLYVDGVNVPASYNSGTTTVNTSTTLPIYIGAAAWNAGASTAEFHGTLEGVSIFARALSADEIMALYTAGTTI